MNTEEFLKYLGCAVLGLLFIYFITMILKVNNDFIGSVLGGKFREGLSNKDEIKKKIKELKKENDNAISTLNDHGGDVTQNKDSLISLIDSWKERVMKQFIVDGLMVGDEKKLKEQAKDSVNLLTVLNELEEFVDGK
jgi:hypothetical protein